ncbi:hypothetical protein PflCFBP13517_26595 [Pseudomonas fluorescens]|nr:hypothetical protein PflCFBP13517_26595 [Pseudomonas fluorescens]
MYDKGSCELSYKPYYHLLEAVIRWCGLLDNEPEILYAYAQAPHTFATAFPHWPCLNLNLDKLFDAVVNNDLRYGSLGVMVKPGSHVPPEFLTVRHNDLKTWMQRYYPDQKPSFLFDSIERVTLTAISLEALHILQAERDALRVSLNELRTSHQSMQEQHVAVVTERDRLLQVVGDEAPLSERSQRGYECVLGAMLQVIFGRSPAGQRYSIFDSQESLVTAIVAHSGDLLGISKRSLDTKFAAARRRLKDP